MTESIGFFGEIRTKLGESPLWDPDSGTLWWIDGLSVFAQEGLILGADAEGRALPPLLVVQRDVNAVGAAYILLELGHESVIGRVGPVSDIDFAFALDGGNDLIAHLFRERYIDQMIAVNMADLALADPVFHATKSMRPKGKS